MAQVLFRQEDIDNLTPNELNIFKNTLGVDNLTPGEYSYIPKSGNYNNLLLQQTMKNLDTATNLKNPTFGASGTNTQALTGGALNNITDYIPQAQTLMSTLYGKTPEQQEREDRINTGMMFLNFFTKMAAEASKPGATGLGSASIAGADTAQLYIDRINKERERKLKERQGVVSLATQLYAKDKPTGAPKDYTVVDANFVNRSLGTNFKQGDKVSLTANEFNKVPRGSLVGYEKETPRKQVPIYETGTGTVKMVEEFGDDYKTQLGSGKYTTEKPEKPQTYEDEFGDKRYLTGPYEGQLVSEVLNSKKAENQEDIDDTDLKINEEEKPKLKRLNKVEMGYVKQYRSEIEKLTKDFRDIQSGYQKIKKFYDTKGPIGDYGLAVQFAKLIDPGSVAREGEVAAVQKAGSLPDSVKAALINALNGMGALPPRLRADIYNRSIEIFNTERTKAVDIINKFKGLLSSDLQDDKQGARLDFFTVEPEVPLEDLIDINKIKEETFVFDEKKIEKMSIPQLRDIVKNQDLSLQQLIFVKEVVKKKRASNK
jgi:hypothetical protein